MVVSATVKWSFGQGKRQAASSVMSQRFAFWVSNSTGGPSGGATVPPPSVFLQDGRSVRSLRERRMARPGGLCRPSSFTTVATSRRLSQPASSRLPARMSLGFTVRAFPAFSRTFARRVTTMRGRLFLERR